MIFRNVWIVIFFVENFFLKILIMFRFNFDRFCVVDIVDIVDIVDFG